MPEDPVSASTTGKDAAKAELEKTNNVEAASYLGTIIAKRALEAGITEVVFDRGGFIYQGKIKALAEARSEVLREEAKRMKRNIIDPSNLELNDKS